MPYWRRSVYSMLLLIMGCILMFYYLLWSLEDRTIWLASRQPTLHILLVWQIFDEQLITSAAWKDLQSQLLDELSVSSAHYSFILPLPSNLSDYVDALYSIIPAEHALLQHSPAFHTCTTLMPIFTAAGMQPALQDNDILVLWQSLCAADLDDHVFVRYGIHNDAEYVTTLLQYMSANKQSNSFNAVYYIDTLVSIIPSVHHVVDRWRNSLASATVQVEEEEYVARGAQNVAHDVPHYPYFNVSTCINFNFLPFPHTLTLLLRYCPYFFPQLTFIVPHEQVSFSQPTKTRKLWKSWYWKSMARPHNLSSSIGWLHCEMSYGGWYQQHCISKCLEHYDQTDGAGIMYAPDDAFINATALLSLPTDRLWFLPSLPHQHHYLDPHIATANYSYKGPFSFWFNLQHTGQYTYYRKMIQWLQQLPAVHRSTLDRLHGSGIVKTSVCSDFIYLPTLHQQHRTFSTVLNESIHFFSPTPVNDIFTEIALPIVVDLHRGALQHAHYPPVHYIPSHAYVWRENRSFTSNGIELTRRILHATSSDPPFLHAIKLSDAKNFSSRLWEEGMRRMTGAWVTQRNKFIAWYELNRKSRDGSESRSFHPLHPTGIVSGQCTSRSLAAVAMAIKHSSADIGTTPDVQVELDVGQPFVFAATSVSCLQRQHQLLSSTSSLASVSTLWHSLFQACQINIRCNEEVPPVQWAQPFTDEQIELELQREMHSSGSTIN